MIGTYGSRRLPSTASGELYPEAPEQKRAAAKRIAAQMDRFKEKTPGSERPSPSSLK
jgi:hypothetical protein